MNNIIKKLKKTIEVLSPTDRELEKDSIDAYAKSSRETREQARISSSRFEDSMLELEQLLKKTREKNKDRTVDV